MRRMITIMGLVLLAAGALVGCEYGGERGGALEPQQGRDESLIGEEGLYEGEGVYDD